MLLSMSRIVGFAIGTLSIVRAAPLSVVRDHPESASQRATVAGTYRIVLCKSAQCSIHDTTRAVAWGELVLADRALPDSLQRRLPDHFLSGAPNGCYAVQRRQPERTLAGLESTAATYWQKSATKVGFTLYRSPDAAHDVSVIVHGDTLQGTGTSWGPSKADAFPMDFVRAIRIGPPDLRLCRNAKSRAGGV